MTNDPNSSHLVTLFKDAHWRSLDSICSHPLDAEAIEDLGYDILAETLKENRLDNS